MNGEGPVRLRWLVTGLSPVKTGFETRPLRMGFMLDEEPPGQVSVQVLRFYEPSPLNQRSPQIRQYLNLFLERNASFNKKNIKENS
jgi:hypothetical protein